MDLIELHILQSFPVTCLNRDDVGAPKTAMFGGCQRARVSSQCWKREIRDQAKEQNPQRTVPPRIVQLGTCTGVIRRADYLPGRFGPG